MRTMCNTRDAAFLMDVALCKIPSVFGLCAIPQMRPLLVK